MSVLTGGPAVAIDHLDPDAVDEGFFAGRHGAPARAPREYDRPQRAAFYQGHIRGVLARLKQEHQP